MASMSTLTDTFATKDTSKWSWAANASVVSGQLQLTTGSAYQGIQSTAAYDLTGSAVYVKVPQLAGPSLTGSSGVDTQLILFIDANNTLAMQVEGTTLYCQRKVGGTLTTVATPTYSATNHAWWKISESGGTITWSASPDGSTWTSVGSWAWSGLSITAMTVQLQTGYYGTVSSPTAALFDNVNTNPNTGSGSVSLSGSGTLSASGTLASGTPAPNGPPGNWMLAFQDEFTGTSVDTSKWNVTDSITMNNVTTLASNATVSGGVLTLTLSDASHGAYISTGPTGWAQFAQDAYHMNVGDYTEAKVWFPGNGTTLYNWPAWWASCGSNWPTNGEGDIAEVLGGTGGDLLTTNYHYSNAGTNAQAGPFLIPGYWGDGWHSYGLHRKSSTLDIYWDGSLVKTISTSDPGTAGWGLMLNIGAGSYGSPTTATGASGAIKVDYVRAWTPNAVTGSAALSGSGTLAVTPTPQPTRSVSFSGSGTTTLTATPKPTQTAALSGGGTLAAQPGTRWQASGSGTLTVGTQITVTTPLTLGSTGTFVARGPIYAVLGGFGTLAVNGGPQIVGRSLRSGELASEGRLAVTGQVALYHFTGPAVVDYRPLQTTFPPNRLVVSLLYGQSVWQAADGSWHQKFGPDLSDLDGAQHVFAGGRIYPLTDAERAALIAGGYGDYITLENV